MSYAHKSKFLMMELDNLRNNLLTFFSNEYKRIHLSLGIWENGAFCIHVFLVDQLGEGRSSFQVAQVSFEK